jgi:hypothetical protein
MGITMEQEKTKRKIIVRQMGKDGIYRDIDIIERVVQYAKYTGPAVNSLFSQPIKKWTYCFVNYQGAKYNLFKDREGNIAMVLPFPEDK